MNYQHSYHAGNFADVIKHSALLTVIEKLLQKDKPLLYFDTHAGAGYYDLKGAAALKTKEWQRGIKLFLDNTDDKSALQPYRKLVLACNPGGKLQHYPGSPWLAQQILRSQDRLILCETDRAATSCLKDLFKYRQQTHIHLRDGYEALAALLPATEKRGLVLLDPPYEKPEEISDLKKAVGKAWQLWPQAVYMLWYPITHTRPVKFGDWVKTLGFKDVLKIEVTVDALDRPQSLIGSGLLIINTPWKLEEKLVPELRFLSKILGGPKYGQCRVEWLSEKS